MTFHVTWPRRKTHIFRAWQFFSCSCGNSWFKHSLCNCPQHLCSFRIVVECIPSVHDHRKMLVLPNQLLYWVLSTSDQDFVSFQPILCHPHAQIKIIFFTRCANRHSQFGNLLTSQCFSRIFSNYLSHNSPAKESMTVQIPFKRNDWVFHTGPWFGPFVSW